MSECIFCNRKNFEERLIFENRDFWVIATLGQITDGGYALLIPKGHIPCLGDLATSFQAGQHPMFDITKRLVFRAISLEYAQPECGAITTFEHGIVGQTIEHAHLHILPMALDPTSRIMADFPGSEIQELDSFLQIQELYSENPRPYLFWSILNTRFFVCWDPPAPAQYLRTVFADLLGKPERANWRNMDPDLDKKLWSGTVERLKPYFTA
ncbi:MAG: hypothetical protein WD898_03195 [Candidatus Paceibacterota bacterium]